MNIGTRVEIASHYDLWMSGARYGNVERMLPGNRVRVKLDKVSRAQVFPREHISAI